MKKIAIFTLVGLLLFAPGLCFPNGARVAILLDNSGSMTGFYKGNQYLQLADIIKESQGSGEAIVFQFNQDGPERIDDVHDFNPSTRDTRIDQALAKVIADHAPDIIWILTDNYQDAPGYGEPGDIEGFYNRLLGDDIKKINIFPVSLLFDGNLALYCDQQGNPTGQSHPVIYRGKKGLLVYSILINETKSPEYEALINGVSQRYAHPTINSRPLLCKPLSADTVALDICEAPPGFQPSNLELARGRLVGEGFREGKRIEAFFYTRLKSSFRYLRLMDAVLKGRQAEGFRTEGFREPVVQSRVAPDKLADPLEPGQASGIVYRVNIDIEKLMLKKDLRSMVHAALNDKGLIEGRMLLFLEVPEESFRFTDEILREYNTDNICDTGQENQKKIYGMGMLIPKMAPKIVSIPVFYGLKLEVKYPKWPLIVLIASLLFAVLALIGAYKALSSVGSVKYEVRIDECDPIIFGLGPFMSKSIKLGDTIGLKVSKKFSNTVIGQTANGFVFADEMKMRRLEDQDAFTISREAGDSYEIRFARLSDKKKDDDTSEATADHAIGDDYADF